MLKKTLLAAASLVASLTLVATPARGAPAPVKVNVISEETAMACGARMVEGAPLGATTILDRYIAKKKLTNADGERVRDECAAFDLGAAFVLDMLSRKQQPVAEEEEPFHHGPDTIKKDIHP